MSKRGRALVSRSCSRSSARRGARAADAELAASKDATFRRGNDAYFHGHYGEAVDAYEQVAALGVRLGRSLLQPRQRLPEERASSARPSTTTSARSSSTRRRRTCVQPRSVARDAARKKGEDRLVGVEGTPLWMRAGAPYRSALSSWLFLGLYVALFVLLIVLHFVQPGFLRVGMWAGFAFVGIGHRSSAARCSAARLYLADRVEQAIVPARRRCRSKRAPTPNYQSVFSVHAGLRVRVTEKEQDWVRVRLANGLEGWLRERDLGRL